MSKVADSIRRGLEEVVAYERGEAKESDYRVHVPARIDVRAIRTKLGMTGRSLPAGSDSASTR
jgi:putative transcriptional regulator